MRSRSSFVLVGLASITQFDWLLVAAKNFSTIPWGQHQSLLPRQVTVFDDRPADCPPCFNCNLEDFQCQQFGSCGVSSGKCKCPEGFGGDDCGTPLCGSPIDGQDRVLRLPDQKECQCSEGWDGVNCNVCTSDLACDALMPEGKDGVCYQRGLVQKQNYQFCDVTNQGIVDALDPRRPQATFSCNAANRTCDFQYTCHWDIQGQRDRNITTYSCDHIQCRCIPGRFLCGEDGGLDISDFINEQITGPAAFKSVSSDLDTSLGKTTFEEPHLDGLLASVFGDDSIYLSCTGGECLYKTEVPGYEKHAVKPANTNLIAGIISGCASFVIVLSLIFVWLSRKQKASSQYDRVRFEDESKADAALMADHKPTTLHFENVSYRVGGRQILSGVQGSVRPGELLAIIGASGAGKTTFLDILARKNKRGSARGSYYVNGETISDDEFRDMIGFVDQDDTMLPTLTVHETILDSAMLRLPRSMSLAAKQQKAEDVERQLGIHHIRDSIIGSAEGRRGISGGEKRRVSIACELVTSPSILFLDEPTSGLDASNAYNVVECLVNLAKVYDRTVVFSIHQPRSNIIALFDRLVLLAKGRTVYSGPFSECQTYFRSIGYPCPDGFNIADYLLDLTVHAGRKHVLMDGTDGTSPVIAEDHANHESLIGSRTRAASITSVREQQERLLFTRKSTDSAESRAYSNEELPKALQDPSWLEMSETAGSAPLIPDGPRNSSDKISPENGTDLDKMIGSYYTSAIAAQVQEDIREAIDQVGRIEFSSDDTKARTKLTRLRNHRKIGVPRQFMILATRTWRNLYRNPMLLLTHYAISILLAVLLGYLFFGLTDDIPGFQNRMGILSFVLALFGFSTLTTLTVFADERLLFMRERAKGYYHPSAYFAAKVFFDIVPLRLVPPIILSIIVYPMTGLVATWSHFLTFVLILMLFNFAAAAVCLFIGIVIREAGTANLLGSLVMLFSLLFSGLFLNHDKIPAAAMWLQQLSIFHYAFEGLLINEVRLLTLTEHKWGLNVEVPGASILSSFGFKIQALWMDIAGLGIFAGVFVVLAYAAMHFLLVEKR